jgi:hypothetical protein
MTTYSEPLPTDSASKKFLTPLADNASTNEFTAIAGANYRTQNGEPVSDIIVEVTTSSGAGETIGEFGDTAVTTDDPGTLASFARGAVVLLLDVATYLSTLLGRLPSTIGQKAKATSLAVTLASDEDFVHAEDAAHVGGDKGVQSLAVRKDTAAALAGTDGDYLPLIVDSTGRLWVHASQVDQLPTSLGQKTAANSLSIIHASDQAQLVCADDGLGSNNYVQRGGKQRTQNGADVGDSSVCNPTQLPESLGQKAMAESTGVTLATNQQAGYRREKAGESYLPAGDLVAQDGDPLATGDFDIRDTDEHWVYIPMSGWRDALIEIGSSAAWDQAVTLTFYAAYDTTLVVFGKIAEMILPTATPVAFSVGNGAVGQGGAAGGATAANAVFYNVPALACRPGYIAVRAKAAVAPAGGTWEISVQRTA